jgi:hypothetical protein
MSACEDDHFASVKWSGTRKVFSSTKRDDLLKEAPLGIKLLVAQCG